MNSIATSKDDLVHRPRSSTPKPASCQVAIIVICQPMLAGGDHDSPLQHSTRSGVVVDAFPDKLEDSSPRIARRPARVFLNNAKCIIPSKTGPVVLHLTKNARHLVVVSFAHIKNFLACNCRSSLLAATLGCWARGIYYRMLLSSYIVVE